MAKLTFKLAGVKLHIPDARLRFRVRKGGTVRSLTLEAGPIRIGAAPYWSYATKLRITSGL